MHNTGPGLDRLATGLDDEVRPDVHFSSCAEFVDDLDGHQIHGNKFCTEACNELLNFPGDTHLRDCHAHAAMWWRAKSDDEVDFEIIEWLCSSASSGAIIACFAKVFLQTLVCAEFEDSFLS